MLAARVSELGPIENVSVEEVDPPQIEPGKVRIAVHTAGLNFADSLMISGVYQHKPQLPFTPGMEMAGEVIEVGEGVSHVRPGQRVCAFARWGGFAEEAVVLSADAFPIPDDLDFVTAAALPVAYGTAHLGLEYRARLKAGEVLLISGAAGGVGLAAVEIGKALGATVIATASSEKKLATAKEHGADYLIDYSKEDVRDRVKELVGGADVFFDPVGGDAFKTALRCMNFEGRLVIIGFAGGDIQQIASNHVLVKNVDVIGFAWTNYRDERPELYARCMDEVGKLYSAGKLKPLVSETFALGDVVEALRVLTQRRAQGKVVLQIR